MSVLDQINDFESQPLSTLAYNLIKWFCFDEVEIRTVSRTAVESMVWITISIEKGSKRYYIEGQRIDIVKRRLLELLEREFQLPHKNEA